MPALGPLGIGVLVTDQCSPRSAEVKTRDEEPPPEAKNAFPPADTRHVPLAAKANSPSSAAGIPADGSTCHERPPSLVLRIRNFPSTGSDSTSPCRRSRNVMQS